MQNFSSQDNDKTPLVNIVVSLLEAAMIKTIRNYEYGSFTVHKLSGEPRRIEILGSEILKPEDGKKLDTINQLSLNENNLR